ncbi:hypothetical protein ACVWZ4_004379 [Bradyrhizobium sp. USDA 4472]
MLNHSRPNVLIAASFQISLSGRADGAPVFDLHKEGAVASRLLCYIKTLICALDDVLHVTVRLQKEGAFSRLWRLRGPGRSSHVTYPHHRHRYIVTVPSMRAFTNSLTVTSLLPSHRPQLGKDAGVLLKSVAVATRIAPSTPHRTLRCSLTFLGT